MSMGSPQYRQFRVVVPGIITCPRPRPNLYSLPNLLLPLSDDFDNVHVKVHAWA